jgi:hypothetical protein
MSEHSRLSASGAHRWMACPGSIRLSEGLPERPSPYADEGTAAHELAAWALRSRRYDAYGLTTDTEMAAAVDVYLEVVRTALERGDTLLIEHRVDLGRLDPPVAMYGTADAIILKPKRRQLVVIDLKYGAGVPVEAENNPQTRYYALGALQAIPIDLVIDTVELVIVQPRRPHPAGPVRREILLALELALWGRKLLAAAHRALAPQAPLAPGSWCRFCPAQLTCPALYERALVEAQNDFTVNEQARFIEHA